MQITIKASVLLVLTLLDEQVGESEHHSVSTVEEISTQEMGAGNGQTPTWDHLQNSLDLGLGVPMELREYRKYKIKVTSTF